MSLLSSPPNHAAFYTSASLSGSPFRQRCIQCCLGFRLAPHVNYSLVIRGVRVEDGEAFQGRNVTENLVRAHQGIYPDTKLHL
jgi:hypothetical protein